jgi:site-specific DNA-cytosine methylase
MANAIFTTQAIPTYDDLPEIRYHFPATYLRIAEQAVGDWIVYYEPRREKLEKSSRDELLNLSLQRLPIFCQPRPFLRVGVDGTHEVVDAASITERLVNGGRKTQDLSEIKIMRAFQVVAEVGKRSAEKALADGESDSRVKASWLTGGCVNPSKGRFLHPTQNRTITLREAALLQTFPVSYFFSLNSGKFPAAQMIGNALPPEFIRRHALQVQRTLRRKDTA